jgi:type III secretion protein Q
MIERFPFAEVNPREARIDNWLSTPREGVTLTLGEGYEHEPGGEGAASLATITPCAIAHARAQMGRTILVRGMLDGHDVEIMCDTGLVETLVGHSFGPVDQSLLASGERALVLEHAMAGIIAMLERDFGMAVRFEWAAPDVESDLPVIGAVRLVLQQKPRPGHAVIHGAAPVAEMFRSFVESCAPGRPNGLKPNIHVALIFGSTRLSIAEMRGLAVGDTILIDDTFEADRPLRAIAGKTLIAAARFSGPRVETVSGFAPLRGGNAFRWLIEPIEGVNFNMAEPDNIVASSLGDMKVRLVFEVGRAELSVAEIERLGPGHVFELSRASDGHVDVIAGGRVIGSGEIVKIGDDIGVRLKRIAT